MMRRSLVPLLVLLASVAATAEAPPSQAPEWVTAGRVPAGRSLVLVHNASGKTLLASKYVVQFDRKKVAKLGRGEFTAVLLDPGSHRGGVGGGKAHEFVTEAGRVSHWVVAYSPARSWGAPFAGNPLATGLVPDSVGAGLLRAGRWVEPLLPLPVLGDSSATTPR